MIKVKVILGPEHSGLSWLRLIRTRIFWRWI